MSSPPMDASATRSSWSIQDPKYIAKPRPQRSGSNGIARSLVTGTDPSSSDSSETNTNSRLSVSEPSTRSDSPPTSTPSHPHSSSSNAVYAPQSTPFLISDAPSENQTIASNTHSPRPSHGQPSQPPSISIPSSPSPLNPTSTSTQLVPRTRTRRSPHPSIHFRRIASEESRTLSTATTTPLSSIFPSSERASMVLYHVADDIDDGGPLRPPAFPSDSSNRNSFSSVSGDSFISLSSDSKYPAGGVTGRGGVVPYAYDPGQDTDDLEGEDDGFGLLQDKDRDVNNIFTWRGLTNLGTLVLIVAGLLGIFVAYPVVIFSRGFSRNKLIVDNPRINSSGQVTDIFLEARSQSPLYVRREAIDSATPQSAWTWRPFDDDDGGEYELIFSDEFELDGRTFYPGDDDTWKSTQEDFDGQQQLTTRAGNLEFPPCSKTATHFRLDLRSTVTIALFDDSSIASCAAAGPVYVHVGMSLPQRSNHVVAIVGDLSPSNVLTLNFEFSGIATVHIDSIRLYQHQPKSPSRFVNASGCDSNGRPKLYVHTSDPDPAP